MLPRQLLSVTSFRALFAALRSRGMSIEDFRTNGVLLPGTESISVRHWLPMHRGPHRIYNEMVMDRLGAVEASWIAERACGDRRANGKALARIRLIQRALDRRLRCSDRKPILLNRNDPIGQGVDFSDLDAMAERLWRQTTPPAEPRVI